MFLRIFILIIASQIVACGETGSNSSTFSSNSEFYLPIQNEIQQTPNWCWVATSRQIIASLPQGPKQSTPPQCVLAGDALNAFPSDLCCNNPAACNVPGMFQHQQYLIAKYGGRPSAIAQPTDAASLFRTIQSGYGVILAVRGTGQVGHVVVLRGMFWQNGTPYVVINDPISIFPSTYSYYELLNYWQAALVIG